MYNAGVLHFVGRHFTMLEAVVDVTDPAVCECLPLFCQMLCSSKFLLTTSNIGKVFSLVQAGQVPILTAEMAVEVIKNSRSTSHTLYIRN